MSGTNTLAEVAGVLRKFEVPAPAASAVRRFRHLYLFSAALAMCLTLVSSCDTEDPPVQLFELEIRESYPSATSDNWVIASNMQGEPIASKFFENGETITLEGISPVEGLINITLVIFTPAANSSNDRDYFFFNTYTDVPVGNKWYLKRLPPLASENAGKVAVHIANLPGSNSDLSISSFNRRNEVTSSPDGSTISFQVGLRKSPSDLFFSVVDATPRFLKIDVGDGDELNFDYQSDFTPFDNILPLTFSVSNLVVNIQGFNAPIGDMQSTDRNYHAQSVYTGASTGVKVGFNNGYNFYQSSWNATFPGARRVAYYKLGDPPNANSFDPRPNLDFTVLDNAFASLQIDFSEDFSYCMNEYFAADEFSDNKPVTTWQIVRPVTSFVQPLVRFPDEMLERYAYLSSVIHIVNYQRSTFTLGINQGEYDHYLDERFRSGEFKLFPRETFSLTK
jgi:hypothetical protein